MVRAAEDEENVNSGEGDEGATATNNDNKCSDMDTMKEKFSKLLLGEDMSGGGKGVSSAQALSNAITNLAAAVFGEQSRLEPMPPERKARWRREMDWILSVTDHIVEFVASKQNTNGVNMEVMVTRQRSDLHMNIPALRKLDAMLIKRREGEDVSMIEHYKIGHFSKKKNKMVNEKADEIWNELQNKQASSTCSAAEICLKKLRRIPGHIKGRSISTKQVLATENLRMELESEKEKSKALEEQIRIIKEE